LALLPVVAFESIVVIEDQFALQERVMRSSIEGQPESHRVSPDEVIERMQPIMRGAGYGAVVATVFFVVVINGLLLFFMTRPAVGEYLKNAAEGKDGGIPQYDPSMGMMPQPQPVQPPPPGPDQQ